ncbi:MAG TPA: hypothetical protein VFD57_05650 [Clostridia bacterium]|nr:hypothetical protein [Clostridia bacterium]HZJ83276.1 hypothetical protein [Clostridia bacterium]
MKWKMGLTLGSKQKEFRWRYSKANGLVIIRTFKNGNKKTEFSNEDIDSIINFIKEEGIVPLANNVVKLSNGTEKEGIGRFIYQNISNDTTNAQTASQLASILYNTGVLGYNGAVRGMEFWILDDNWKEKLEK